MARLKVKEAAAYCRLSAATLNRLRQSGGGPPYSKVASRVTYDTRDLDAWLEAGKVRSTADEAATARRAGARKP